MKFAKSGLMFLSAALVSGCGQDVSQTFNDALAAAKAKMAENVSAQSEIAAACALKAEPDTELLNLRQQLKQARQQLADSNAALRAAQEKLKAGNKQSAELQQEQTLLRTERTAMETTTRHVRQLEQQLTNQDAQLNELQKTLLDTEAGCRAVAEELARKT